MNTPGLSRRSFLAWCGLGASSALLPMRASATSANTRVQVGLIGVGAAGRAHMRALLQLDASAPRLGALVAIADVDARRLAAAQLCARAAGMNVRAYADYREMLGDSTIDAIIVATPDHWHAAMASHAAASGKSIYIESPVCRSEAQASMLARLVREQGCILFGGLPHRSDDALRLLAAWLRAGSLGEVRRAVCTFGPNPFERAAPDEPPPSHLDWRAWLGPAQTRPFNRAIHPYGWRYFRAYGGGVLGDCGVHWLDIALAGCGMASEHPRHIEAHSHGPSRGNAFELPTAMHAAFDFGDVELEWRQAVRPEADPAHICAAPAHICAAPAHTYGVSFHGSQGDLFVNHSVCLVKRPGDAWKTEPSLAPIGQGLGAHQAAFLEAVRAQRVPNESWLGAAPAVLAHQACEAERQQHASSVCA